MMHKKKHQFVSDHVVDVCVHYFVWQLYFPLMFLNVLQYFSHVFLYLICTNTDSILMECADILN